MANTRLGHKDFPLHSSPQMPKVEVDFLPAVDVIQAIDRVTQSCLDVRAFFYEVFSEALIEDLWGLLDRKLFLGIIACMGLPHTLNETKPSQYFDCVSNLDQLLQGLSLPNDDIANGSTSVLN